MIDFSSVIGYLATGGVGVIIYFLLRMIKSLDKVGQNVATLKTNVAVIKADIDFHNKQTEMRFESGMQRIVDNERAIKDILSDKAS